MAIIKVKKKQQHLLKTSRTKLNHAFAFRICKHRLSHDVAHNNDNDDNKNYTLIT